MSVCVSHQALEAQLAGLQNKVSELDSLRQQLAARWGCAHTHTHTHTHETVQTCKGKSYALTRLCVKRELECLLCVCMCVCVTYRDGELSETRAKLSEAQTSLKGSVPEAQVRHTHTHTHAQRARG